MKLRDLRVRPLALVAAGLVLVALDFRTRSLDFLPDVLGWVFVAAGARMAAVRSASVVALAAAILSLSELVLPYRLVRFDADRGEYIAADTPGTERLPLVQRWDDLPLARGAIVALAMVLGGVSVVLLVRALATRARAVADHSAARQLFLAALAAGTWPLPFVAMTLQAGLSGDDYDPVWQGSAEYGWLLSVLLLVSVAALLVMRRDREWAFPHEQSRSGSWPDLRRFSEH